MTQQTYEQPPTVAERADDELYANAVNALAAVFRMDIEHTQHTDPRIQFARMMDIVSRLMRDGWGASDAVFVKDVFDTHGPGAVLLALKRAYEIPQPSAPLVGD